MATVTTNYGFDIPQSSDLVKDGATAIALLGQDIDTAMNTALGTKKAGMVLLNTTSFSAVSSQSVNDVFSATYENYMLVLNVLSSAADNIIRLRLRASGTDASGSDYNSQALVVFSTTVSGSRITSASSLDIFRQDTSWNGATSFIHKPNLATATQFNTSNAWSLEGARIGLYTGSHSLTNAYTGYTLLPASGTITGTISTYGINK
jgi:hypothetical protein